MGVCQGWPRGLMMPAWRGRVGGVIDRHLREKGVKDECACRCCLNKNGTMFWVGGRSHRRACVKMCTVRSEKTSFFYLQT